MKLNSSSKSTTILLLTVLLLVLLFAVYYYVVSPKKEEARSLERSVSSLQSEIASIQEQITAIETEKNAESANEFELRKKVPQTRQIDQIILSIEESEYISGSRIVAVEFNNYDSLVLDSEITDPNSKPEEGATDGTTPEEGGTDNGQVEEEGEQPVSPIVKETLPAALKLITFNVEVEAPDYDSLLKFIKEVESLERIMHIDIIEYSLPGEENEFAENKEPSIAASIQVTTFYYEGE